MRPRFQDGAVLALCALAPATAVADVYTWVDEQGTVHFQDAPPTAGKGARKLASPPGERSPWRSSSAEVISPSVESRGDAPPAAPDQQAQRSASQPRRAPAVDLYTTSWCPWCKKAREYFRSRGIEFTDHDIEKDAGARERKLGMDGDVRVPTAVIDGKVVRGYSPASYQAAMQGR